MGMTQQQKFKENWLREWTAIKSCTLSTAEAVWEKYKRKIVIKMTIGRTTPRDVAEMIDNLEKGGNEKTTAGPARNQGALSNVHRLLPGPSIGTHRTLDPLVVGRKGKTNPFTNKAQILYSGYGQNIETGGNHDRAKISNYQGY